MGDREAGERQTRQWASLGPEQSAGLEREARPQTRAHKLFLQRHRGDNLPPLPWCWFPIVHVVVPWARRVVTDEVSPAWSVETCLQQHTTSIRSCKKIGSRFSVRQRSHQLFCHSRLSFGGGHQTIYWTCMPLGSPLVHSGGPIHLMTMGGQRLSTTPQESRHSEFVASKFAETWCDSPRTPMPTEAGWLSGGSWRVCLRKMRATTTLIEDPALLECVPHRPDAVGGARILDGPEVFPRSSSLALKQGETGHLSTQQPMGQTCGLRPSTSPTLWGHSTSVPQLRLPLVETDPCVVPHLAVQRLVECFCSIRFAAHVNVVHECEQAL